MTLEYIHVTVMHGCGHEMLRAVRRDDETTLANVKDGEMVDWRNCKHCIARALRVIEQRMEKAGKL